MRTTVALGILTLVGCIAADAPIPDGDAGAYDAVTSPTAPRFRHGPADDPATETTDPPDDLGDADGATLTSSPHPRCLEPAPNRGAFRDGTADSGVDFVHAPFPEPQSGRIEDILTARFQIGGLAGGGVAAADLDDDGRPDLIFAQIIGPNAVYWGVEDGFVPATNTGLELPSALSVGVSTADYNGDGLPDVAIFGLDLLRLFRNDGDGTFTDVTSEEGLAAAAGWTTGVSWADVDLDGDLDLLAAGYAVTLLSDGIPLQPTETRLWRNDHTRFVDVSQSLPPEAVHGAALLATFRDFDADGDPDLLLTHDFGEVAENTVLLDNAGLLDDGTPHWIDRFDTSGAGTVRAPMGGAVRDLDGDGRIDLWFSDLGGLRPLRAVGEFDFLDASLSWGVELSAAPGDTSWSVVALDLGGWGRPGLFHAYGPLPTGYRDAASEILEQPDRWLHARAGGGETVFEETDDVLPPGPAGNSRGVAVSDLDRNGVPDLVVGRIGEGPRVLLGRCTDANRLVVELDDARRADPRSVGAVVTVSAGGTTLSRTMDAGGLGTFSGSEPILFFGLGARDEVDALVITWPDGLEDRFEDVCSHCRVRVSRD